LIYQALSRMTEFHHFAGGFRSAIESLVAKITGNPFTGCKGGLGIIPERDARASRE
jgi:hypothetical protein